MNFKTPRSRSCDLNWASESQNMQLYLYVHKCSCRQWYVTLVFMWYVTLVFMTQSSKIVLKTKLYVASGSVPPPYNEKHWVCTWLRLYNAELQDD